MFNTEYYKRLHKVLLHEYEDLTKLLDDADSNLDTQMLDNLTMIVIAHDTLSAYLSALEVLMEDTDA